MNLTELRWSGRAPHRDTQPTRGVPRSVARSFSTWKWPFGPPRHTRTAEQCPVRAGMLARPRPALRAHTWPNIRHTVAKWQSWTNKARWASLTLALVQPAALEMPPRCTTFPRGGQNNSLQDAPAPGWLRSSPRRGTPGVSSTPDAYGHPGV
eukprot:4304625-Alexandrium_andersonii.AAC.1